jgi:hypothetical protein
MGCHEKLPFWQESNMDELAKDSFAGTDGNQMAYD